MAVRFPNSGMVTPDYEMTPHPGFRHKITTGDYQCVCFFGNRSVKIFRNIDPNPKRATRDKPVGASRGFSFGGSREGQVAVKFEMTKCNQCGSEMLMGVTTCPSCGKAQSGYGRTGGLHTPGTMLAVALAVAVLLAFNWIKSPAPHASQKASPPAVTAPAR